MRSPSCSATVPGPGRVRERVDPGDARGVDGIQRPLERVLGLRWEADDHVGRDVDVRARLFAASRSPRGTRRRCNGGPCRSAPRSSPDCIGTWRCGQTLGSVASASSSESLTWITSTLDSRTRSTPGHMRHRHHQLAELEPLFRIAIVADADSGHAPSRADPPRRAGGPRRARRGRARAGGAPDGGDDAVGAVAVAAVLDLDEPAGPIGRRRGCGATRRCPGPGRRAASRDVVLQVGARAQARRHRPGHLLRGAHERARRARRSPRTAPHSG